MKEKDVFDLVNRYEQMLIAGKSIYFDADEFDDLADYYEEAEDFETAKEIVEAGLLIHPGSQSLMLKNGKYILCEGDYTQALEYFNQNFSAYDFDLYLLKIECFLQLDLYAEAYELTKEVLEDTENELDVILSELGFVYVEADYFDEAILYLQKSLDYNTENIDVLCDLAYAYEMKGDFESAIKMSDKVLDIDPYSYDAWLNVGKLHTLIENFDKAIDAFDFAITINDSEQSVFKMKAHCLSLIGRLQEAVEIFEECILRNDEDESLYFSLAECYLSLEQYDNMLKALDGYEHIKGQTAESQSKRAYAFLQKGDKETANKIIEDGLLVNPESTDLNLVAGELRFIEGEFSEAEAFFIKALPDNETNEQLLDKLSSIYILNDDFDKAVIYLEKILTINPLSSYKTRLVLLYFEIGDRDKFEQCLDLFNNDELRELLSMFFSDLQIDSATIDRAMLIQHLNDARECRLLFKNLKY